MAWLVLSHRNEAAWGTGSPPQRPVPSAEKFGHPQLQASTGFRRAQASLSACFQNVLSPHPYNPFPPSRSRGAFLHPSALLREGRGHKLLRVALRESEETSGGRVFLTPLAFVSYLPSFPGSSGTPDLASAQAHQNSPARLPRSCHPGDHANSSQSASVGRGFAGAFLWERWAGWRESRVEAELSPRKLRVMRSGQLPAWALIGWNRLWEAGPVEG